MKKIILEFSSQTANCDELIAASVNYGVKSYYTADETIERLQNVAGAEIFSPLVDAQPQFRVFSVNKLEEAADALSNDENATILINVTSKAGEKLAIAVAKLGPKYVIVEAPDWKVIPFENLIAAFHTLDAQLIARVANVQEADLMLHTLERGVNGVMLAPTSPNDILDLKNMVTEATKVDLVTARVVSIQEIPRGDRVCVDTTSMLRAGEGMLVGSTARGFVLVHAEVFETEFVASRPFRVNAGDVSAYIIVPGEDPADPSQYRTNYLSELNAGSSVVVCDTSGNTRVVTVGRAKIETRPMLVIKLATQVGDQEVPLNVVLQNAETIRVVD